MSRLVVSLVAYCIWIVVTVVGGQWAAKGASGLAELVKNGIGWHFAAACLFLVALIAVFKWRDIRFGFSGGLESLGFMWLPALYLIVLFSMAIVAGLPSPLVIAFLFINTLMVGFSEETMFRGILLKAFSSRLSVWPAILLTSVLFGAVHVLNVFITGELVPAMVQALAAFMSGIMFMAIVIRTGSLLIAILYHALWDFATFLSATSPAAGETAQTETGLVAMIVPVLFVLPQCLYGFYLLRNVASEPRGA